MTLVLYRIDHYADALVMTTHLVVSTTPRGCWIEAYGGARRWVSAHTKKRFAHPTREEAVKAFKARKARQIDILTSRLAIAKKALAADLSRFSEGCTCVSLSSGEAFYDWAAQA